MDLSIVLCTYNNDSRLRITLESFKKLSVPEELSWEFVVVNNNSTDRTKEVIHSFSGSLPISYAYEPDQGLSRARNAGLERAQGELIVFTDDDVRPNIDWLTAYWNAYQERPKGYFFGGPIESEFEDERPDEDLLQAAMPSVAGLDFGNEARQLASEEYFIGPNWACPAQYLEPVGAFDEKLGLNPASGEVRVGEETDLMQRLEDLGVHGWYVPGAKIRHFVPAEKATLEHVVARRTCGAERAYLPGSPMPFTLLGVPVGLYKGVTMAWMKWIARRMTGRDWKAEYVRWKGLSKLVRSYHRRGKKRRTR
jgi:glycosyltransferase involved in cell wall biosynthesis